MNNSLPPSYAQCQAEFLAKRVTCRPSTDGRYEVFNYAETVEFDDLWNDINVWCRGIVFDVGVTPPKCVAVPLKKFWNIGQRPETRVDNVMSLGEPVDTRAKLDGSLGVTFLDNLGKLRITTRGSLESDQAHWATAWINDSTNYVEGDGSYDALRFVIENLGYTPLFEIIYHDNRIVVPYDFEGLVCLGMVDRLTGRVLGLNECEKLFPSNWPKASDYTGQTLAQLLEAAKSLPYSFEGWVVRFQSGLMAKVKGDAYLRVHKIRFGMSPKRIQESLLAGVDPACIEGYPDEFMKELREIRDAIVAATDSRMFLVKNVYVHAALLSSRKEQALLAKQSLPVELLSSFFALLDGDEQRSRRLAMSGVNIDNL